MLFFFYGMGNNQRHPIFLESDVQYAQDFKYKGDIFKIIEESFKDFSQSLFRFDQLSMIALYALNDN